MPIKENNSERKRVIALTNSSDYEPVQKIKYYVDGETIKALLSGNQKVKELFLKHDQAIAISELVKEQLFKESIRENNQELYDIYKEVFKIYSTWQVNKEEYYRKCVQLEQECRKANIDISEETIKEMALCYQSMLNWDAEYYTVYVTAQSVTKFTKFKNFRVENWLAEKNS